MADIENVPDEQKPEKEEDLELNFKEDFKEDFANMTEIDGKLLLKGAQKHSRKIKKCIFYPEDLLRVYWDVLITS